LEGLPAPFVCHIDQQLAVKYPFKVGALEFRGYCDNETDNPGLGYSVGYGAPRIAATLYVYDRQPPLNSISSSVEIEFQRSVRDLITANEDAKRLESGNLPESFSAEALCAAFELPRNRMHTLVVLDHGQARFLKWRITCPGDERRTLAHKFLAESRAMLSCT
jgi:hypothetical protein